jgi:hypothetical protein
VSLSRRDRRLGVYSYTNTGREGVVVDTWTLAGTFWGRVDDYRGRLSMVAEAPEVAIDAVIQFSFEPHIPPNAIVVDGTLLLDGSFNLDGTESLTGQPGDGTAGVYRIESVVPKRMHRTQLAYSKRLNRNAVNLTALVLNGQFILDGSAVLSGILG